MIKTFRGQIADSTVETIRLSTNNGMIGYKIKKLSIMPTTFQNAELIVRIWSRSPDTISDPINFDDNSMLAVGMYSSSSTGETNPEDEICIFDNVTFNQDIFITNTGISNAQNMNYYLELEQVSLDLGEATVATLKDMRGSN
jgi:hypothetical protein